MLGFQGHFARVTALQLKLACILMGVLLLVGCGGGGAPGLNPTLTINWGARSRDVNAPTSAVSVEVMLSNGKTSTIDRGATPTAFTQTYTVPLGTPEGSYTVTLNFYSVEGGTGEIVGTATGSATISSTALSLGTFTTVGTVATVGVLPSQSVPVGSTIQASAAAYNSTPIDLVVTPGSITWNTVRTDGSMTLTADGKITATAVGSITVTAMVDGVVSPAQTITSYAGGAVANCTNSTYLPNYATAMETSTSADYHGVLRHWTSFPVTVAIVNNSYLTSDFSSIATQALSTWTAATGGKVQFTVVAANTNPDIKITFEPSSKIVTTDTGVVGLTTVYPSASNDSILTGADIQIATDLNNDDSTLNDVVHELGHSLGIAGHSQTAQDLMFPYLNDSFAPTTDDVNTLYTGYCGSFPTGSGVKRSLLNKRSTTPTVIIDRRPN